MARLAVIILAAVAMLSGVQQTAAWDAGSFLMRRPAAQEAPEGDVVTNEDHVETEGESVPDSDGEAASLIQLEEDVETDESLKAEKKEDAEEATEKEVEGVVSEEANAEEDKMVGELTGEEQKVDGDSATDSGGEKADGEMNIENQEKTMSEEQQADGESVASSGEEKTEGDKNMEDPDKTMSEKINAEVSNGEMKTEGEAVSSQVQVEMEQNEAPQEAPAKAILADVQEEERKAQEEVQPQATGEVHLEGQSESVPMPTETNIRGNNQAVNTESQSDSQQVGSELEQSQDKAEANAVSAEAQDGQVKAETSSSAEAQNGQVKAETQVDAGPASIPEPVSGSQDTNMAMVHAETETGAMPDPQSKSESETKPQVKGYASESGVTYVGEDVNSKEEAKYEMKEAPVADFEEPPADMAASPILPSRTSLITINF